LFVQTSFVPSPDVSVLHLFQDISPCPDDTYELEMGVVLPDLLPNLDGVPEFVVDVALESDQLRLFLSNAMGVVRFHIDREPYHALFPLYAPENLARYPGPVDLTQLAFEPLNTMATARWRLPWPQDQSDVLDALGACTQDLVEALNRLAGALLDSLGEQLHFISPAHDRGSLGVAYLVLRGADPDQFAHARFLLSFRRAQVDPHSCSPEVSRRTRDILAAGHPADTVRTLLYAARSYRSAGIPQFALLQLAMAAEIATAQFVRTGWLARGVSRKKLKEYEHDIGFAEMLNVHLFALCPPERRPDRSLVGEVDRVRRCRNDLVHEAIFELSDKDWARMFSAVERYIALLADLASPPTGEDRDEEVA